MTFGYELEVYGFGSFTLLTTILCLGCIEFIVYSTELLTNGMRYVGIYFTFQELKISGFLLGCLIWYMLRYVLK